MARFTEIQVEFYNDQILNHNNNNNNNINNTFNFKVPFRTLRDSVQRIKGQKNNQIKHCLLQLLQQRLTVLFS